MLKKFKKGDIILMISVIVVTVIVTIVAFIISNNMNSPYVVIMVDGKEYGEYKLNKNETIEISNEYGYNEVVINNGTVYVNSADCKDKVCVKHDSISKNREQIICLPHRLVVEIKSEK